MKVNENGTLLKVKCLILLNIFSVFPTHVGMFLRACIPKRHIQSSPRMWGCSHVHDDESAQIVFPTYVGMFRALYAESRGRVFPTHVGMFLSGSPTSHSVFPTHVGMFLCTHL